MNTKLLEDPTIRSCFQQEWTREKNYKVMLTWWEKYVKQKIRFLFIQEGIVRTREDTINDNFFTLVYEYRTS